MILSSSQSYAEVSLITVRRKLLTSTHQDLSIPTFKTPNTNHTNYFKQDMNSGAHITIHLLKLHPTTTLTSLLQHLESTSPSSVLLKAIPYGWVHEPHKETASQLLSRKWDLFLITASQISKPILQNFVESRVEIPTMISLTEFQTLQSQINTAPKPSDSTSPLPQAWTSPSPQIPPTSIVPSKESPLEVGELRLSPELSTFLSTSIPETVRNSPVCFFNLFKYAKDDRRTHDAYMQGFKDNFGDTAGATIKFFGGVRAFGDWMDANLVQYDSVWHYAYMLSTEVYQELNKTKVAGLEDTCILMVGEMELFQT